MRRLSLLVGACMLAMLAFSPAALAQTDRDCPDFPSQAAAQSYFEAGGGSPTYNFNNLDANHNGVACENYDYGGMTGGTTGMTTTQPPTTTGPVGGGTTTVTSPPVSSGGSGVTPAKPAQYGALPNTGGPVPLLPAAVLLIGGGLVALGISRRR